MTIGVAGRKPMFMSFLTIVAILKFGQFIFLERKQNHEFEMYPFILDNSHRTRSTGGL